MECDDTDNSGALNVEGESRSAVNSLILDYYKKFGRKRDLEQYFSLSTAQSEVRDPTSLFWRRMKSQNDSSDSGEKRSESPTELCRISIKCTVPDPSSSQDENPNTKSDSESPPIIIEEVVPCTSRHSDDEFLKSDDNHSQKSADATLDISMNKPLSPTSSVTSQRKLEWDSLADVGYANESDRKTSASSLSTLERLALKQQYSNDTKQNSEIGLPTDHSTPLDPNDSKYKGKKGMMKKITKFYKKDIEFVEVNVPHSSGTSPPQAINVNLTKRISFNVEKDGGVTVENVKQDVIVNPEKVSVQTDMTPQIKLDKNIQTSLTKSKEKSSSSIDVSKSTKSDNLCNPKIPVIISLNSFRRRSRRRKLRAARRKVRAKKKSTIEKPQATVREKSGEQVSEAESFEYMPGHIYNQNQLKNDENKLASAIGNKSSLESSVGHTTESDKGSKLSFTKDLEKNIDLLLAALHKRNDNSSLKDKLIKEIIQKLLKTKYRDDESTTDILSGLSLSSKILALSKGNYTTTSSSDANNTHTKAKTRPKKSILRVEKFNSNTVFSTSQSAPNLPSVSNSEKPVSSHLSKPLSFSNTESDVSSKEKLSSDTAFAKTSSEELYQKYIEALRREETYKKHLRDKEMFLKQKLVCSDTTFQVPVSTAAKNKDRLKDLISDLTRNNYDDGSGDASKLEGGSNSNMDFERYNLPRKQRSHSVFTLSSGNSDNQNIKNSIKNRLQNEIKRSPKNGSSKDDHYCCCPHHSKNAKFGITDSSVQVNIKNKCGEGCSSETDRKEINIGCENQANNRISPRNTLRAVSDSVTGDIKYVCLCTEKAVVSHETADNFLIYKCSRLTTRGVQNEDAPFKMSNTVSIQCSSKCSSPRKNKFSPALTECCKMAEIKSPRCLRTIESNSSNNMLYLKRTSKSSQTDINLGLNMLRRRSSDRSVPSSSSSNTKNRDASPKSDPNVEHIFQSQKVEEKLIPESTRWMQTEISINPSISDPILSDINIINDRDCAKLVCKQYRDISKPSSESDENNIVQYHSDSAQIDADSEKSDGNDALLDDNGSIERLLEIKSLNEQKVNKAIQSDVDHLSANIKCQGHSMQNTETISDKFTIPIQGTNMTLMVSIGSKDRKLAESKELVPPEITDKAKFVDKSTYFIQACSKAVQCQKTNIFTDLLNDKTTETSPNGDFNSNIVKENTQESLDSLQKCLLVNTYLTKDTQKYNTYPLSVPINDKEIYLRSNTGTDHTEKESYVQTDRLDRKNAYPISVNDEKNYLHSNTDTDHTEKECCVQTDRANRRNAYPISVPINDKKSYLRSNTGIDNIEKEYSVQTDGVDRRNAHPLSVPINDKKSYLRSNTGIDHTEKECSVQTDGVDKRNVKTQQDLPELLLKSSQKNCVSQNTVEKSQSISSEKSSKCAESSRVNKDDLTLKKILRQKSTNESDDLEGVTKDPIMDMIQDITKRYTKKDTEKNKRKKCFKEIITVLNYLLDTEESTDRDQMKTSESGSTPDTDCARNSKKTEDKVTTDSSQVESQARECCETKKFVDKSVQLSKKCKNKKTCHIESSDVLVSTDLPGTSSDSATCKVLRKIKMECEKYHQKRCKSYHSGVKKNEASSTTSLNCERCKRVDHCTCRHKCKGHKSKTIVQKNKKDYIAYNLIIQTSDSVASEETLPGKDCRPLKNIVVKVPSKRKGVEKVPFKEISSKIERDMPHCSPCCGSKTHRSRSLPNESEISSAEDYRRRPQRCTVRDYLEQNRPDFVEKCARRQNCLKLISELRANERAAQRELLSVQLERQATLGAVSDADLRHFAKEIGVELRNKKLAPKFISEREMKRHSEKIYKSLPEVVQKKEEIKKENIKKTNLLMANIFKKLVDPHTGKTINESLKSGELWVNNPYLFKEYFNNPEATQQIFQGPWFKTSDLFCKDDASNYFYTDNLNTCRKMFGTGKFEYSIFGIEELIRNNDNVVEAAVIPSPQKSYVQIPIVCVVTRPFQEVTEKEIKSAIRYELPILFNMRGHVLFFEELPMTTNGRVHVVKLEEKSLNSLKKHDLNLNTINYP